MAGFFDKWERKRAAYKRLPAAVRLPLVVVAFLMIPAGVIAMFTPLAVLEVGSILIFTALTILSFEFDWAHQTLLWLQKKLSNKKVRTRMAVFVGLVLVVYAVVLVRLIRK